MSHFKCYFQFSIFTCHLSLVTCQLSIFFFLSFFFPTLICAQLNAGPDVTINPGVPVTLQASYGLIANELATADTKVEGPFDIGFQFKFYGKIYSKFSVGENGWISFTHEPGWGATRGIRIPSAAVTSPKNCILGPMEDYRPLPEGSPYIFYLSIGKAPHRKLVVMWCQCPMYGCENLSVTFQIVLKEGDTIENHILNKPVCVNWDNKATLGLQNETGYKCDSISGKFRNYTSWSANREGWQYVPKDADTYKVDSIPFALESITPGDKISYHWYVGNELVSDQQSLMVAPSQTTTYRVTCTICNGEEFSDTVTVFVTPNIPNAFTPNGDGINDKFIIIGSPPENIVRYNIQIFDRWGQIVFTSDDIRNPWDGKRNGTGELCPGDVYSWVIYYEDNKKTKVSNKGTVVLLR